MPAPLTKLKLYISSGTDIQNVPPAQHGAIADIFGAPENSVLKPFQIAEKFHPSAVWFRLDVNSPKMREHFKEMAKLGHMGFENFGILLSDVRDFDDIYRARMAAGEEGINLGIHTQFGIVLEYPSLATLHEELIKKGPSLIMIDLDSLSNKMLGKNAGESGIHPSVLKIIQDMKETFSRNEIPVGATGTLLKSRDAIEQLSQRGVNFFAVPPENSDSMKKLLLHAEKKREIEYLRDKIRIHVERAKR